MSECDQCTHMLAQFAVIESKVKAQLPVEVSSNTSKRILNDAHSLMKAKAQKKERLEDFLQEWKDSILPEIKIPALQLSSLAVVLFVVVAVEKSQGTDTDMFEPLNDEVQVMTSTEEL